MNNLTKEDVVNIVNDKLLSNVDGINSAVSNSITIISILLAFFGLMGLISLFQRKKIVDTVMVEVNKELQDAKKRVIQESDEKTNERIKSTIKRYKIDSQKEEYYRNMMFKDLSSILATDLHINETNNIQEVFAIHAERLGVITQLTSGIEKETKKALSKLSSGTYDIIKMESFKKYIEILERKTDIDIASALEEFKAKTITIPHQTPPPHQSPA